ncbi:hypothetical protein FUA25_04125 [Chryseobacterium sp.]|nr:hypothetical protein FUA25_04125 [Chryseobacterium sp.]
MKNIIYVLMAICLSACAKEKSKTSGVQKEGVIVSKTDTALVAVTPKLSKEETLEKLSREIIQSLKAKDYEQFSAFIHPVKGVRFSMYAYVRPEKDKHFSREDFVRYISTRTKFTWGEKDGSGDILVLPLKDYLETWVFKRDFTQSEYHLNTFKGTGNSLNNLKEIYPEADFTENYIAGSQKYSDMDWKALRLVFEEYEGKYYLIAIVNDQWTV